MVKLVISLTSYPNRIRMVHQVIESLFAQTIKADEIVLWLSNEEFPKQYEDLPNSLKCLLGQNGFRIGWVKGNLKSHKKYFYALQNKDNITITVDDDTYYSRDMVKTLIESYQRHPTAVSARCVRMIFRQESEIAKYLAWIERNTEYIDDERRDLCAIGVGGILYPPGCTSDKWFDEQNIREYAENQDDLWLKYNELLDDISVIYTGMNGEDIRIEETQQDVLYVRNALGGDNDICISRLMEMMKKNNKILYSEWFGRLMSIEKILYTKRAYYESEFEKVFKAQGEKDIYICGAGKYAHIVIDFIRSCDKEKYIKAFLVTRNVQNGINIAGDKITLIKELDKNTPFVVICGVNAKNRVEFRLELESYRLYEWIDIDLYGIAWLLEWEEKYLVNIEEGV